MSKSRRKLKTVDRPEWASMTVDLRKKLGLNQVQFSEHFGCSPMAVSRWERGVLEPPSHSYIALGNLAGDPHCWYFWGRAGLNKVDLLRVMPVLQKRLRRTLTAHLEIAQAGTGKLTKKDDGELQLVAVPLLKVIAASHGEKGDDRALLDDASVESVIAAPRAWCPNPATTRCLRVRGTSMSPLIYDGYILAVDSSQSDAAMLNGKVVIAWHKDVGLTVSRLRRYDHTVVLQPENTAYDSLTLSGSHGWRILAKVLWWIGKAP